MRPGGEAVGDSAASSLAISVAATSLMLARRGGGDSTVGAQGLECGHLLQAGLANEVAVAAFLDGRLPFLGIADVVADALAAADGSAARDLDELVAADQTARRHVEDALKVA